jgi:hypothetical protein
VADATNPYRQSERRLDLAARREFSKEMSIPLGQDVFSISNPRSNSLAF